MKSDISKIKKEIGLIQSEIDNEDSLKQELEDKVRL